MELLTPNFNLNNVKRINNNTNFKPAFKANKAELSKELGDYIVKSLNTNSTNLKETFNNPKKRETFLQTLGAIVVATASALTNILTNDDSTEESTDAIPDTALNEQDSTEQTVSSANSNLKFETPRGKKPQLESDFVNFVNENFSNDTTTLDKLKLLFNKYCGHNRNNKHVIENNVTENKLIIQNIFDEIKENVNDTEKLNEIISKYSAYSPVETIQNPIQTEPLTKTVSEVKNTNDTISEDEKEKEIEKNINELKDMILSCNLNIEPKTISKAVSILKKQMPDSLDKVKSIFQDIETSDAKKIFIIDIANKIVSKEAIDEYLGNKFNEKIDFRQYNELKKSGIDNTTIKKISEILMLQYAKNIKILNNNNDFSVQVINDYPINNKFKKIMSLFNIIKSQDITLSSNDTAEFDKTSVVEEFKKDYFRNGGHSTYKNLVSYLYGNRHQINNAGDFDRNQYENRFNYLLNVLNNAKVFNSTLFSNHSKLRFIERFVLSEDFGNKKFEYATKDKVKEFIDELKKELSKGINVNSYYADDEMEKVGAQIRFDNPIFGNMVITLNSQGKMHTII